ncbi:MAG: hypothetical protein VW948_08260, partial [Burkholderiaceae bacterium]
MIAVQLEQISSKSSLGGQCVCLHADCPSNQMTGWQNRVDRQNTQEEEEAFQLLAGRSYAPMHRLSLL